MLAVVARSVVVAGLAYDAYVHWQLAPDFDAVVGSGAAVTVSQGQLFRVEAVLALAALVAVVAVRRRWSAAAAFAVAAGGLAAVLVYRYHDVGPLGPLPDMYDPIWYAEKVGSAIAEGAAAVAAVVVLLVVRSPAARPLALRPRAGSS